MYKSDSGIGKIMEKYTLPEIRNGKRHLHLFDTGVGMLDPYAVDHGNMRVKCAVYDLSKK